MKRLIKVLQRLYARRLNAPAPYDFKSRVYCGLETRRSVDYYWDGAKRADSAHPFFVFQYTLDGWGCYAESSVVRLQPGMAFTAVCPSAHRYYFPAESAGWTFFWFTVHHPYVVSRFTHMVKKCGAVQTVAPESVVISSAIKLFQGVCECTFRDALSEEQALFDFMLAYERVCQQSLYSQPLRDRILDEVRSFVLENLERPIGTAELAQQHDMSRSHFSHYFKTTTGLSPAHYITQVRLQEVSHRLAHSQQKLEALARETGFADANHLCKVFRRHHHLSPGEFRRQMQ